MLRWRSWRAPMSQTILTLSEEVYYWAEGFVELFRTSYQVGWWWYLDWMLLDTCTTAHPFSFSRKYFHNSLTCQCQVSQMEYPCYTWSSPKLGFPGGFVNCYQIWKQAWSLSILSTAIKNQPNEDVKFHMISESLQLKIILVVLPFVREPTRSFNIFAWS